MACRAPGRSRRGWRTGKCQGCNLPRLLCPWDFPGKNTGVGCHFLLQGIFSTQGLKNLVDSGFFTAWPLGKPIHDITTQKYHSSHPGKHPFLHFSLHIHMLDFSFFDKKENHITHVDFFPPFQSPTLSSLLLDTH